MLKRSAALQPLGDLCYDAQRINWRSAQVHQLRPRWEWSPGCVSIGNHQNPRWTSSTGQGIFHLVSLENPWRDFTNRSQNWHHNSVFRIAVTFLFAIQHTHTHILYSRIAHGVVAGVFGIRTNIKVGFRMFFAITGTKRGKDFLNKNSIAVDCMLY